jgi:predicted alpha/beta hydrolase family esterase
VLSLQVCWDRLGDPEVARRRLGDALEAIALHRLPAPPDPSRAVLVGCRTDGYVDPDGVAVLHRHWAGSTLRWLETGHLAGLVAHADELRRAIADAFAWSPDVR